MALRMDSLQLDTIFFAISPGTARMELQGGRYEWTRKEQSCSLSSAVHFDG
ncbi:MAG: hypothetical protein ACLU18_17570 [Bacteroides thetaiotaomicron]